MNVKRPRRTALAAVVLAAAASYLIYAGATNAGGKPSDPFLKQAQSAPCQTGISNVYTSSADYSALAAQLLPAVPDISSTLQAFLVQPTDLTYNTLLADVVATFSLTVPQASPRAIVTLSDGTVVVDTGRNSDSLANFFAKSINENQNSRVGILATQLYPCGLGLETMYSQAFETTQARVSVRLGPYLNSLGTLTLIKNTT